MNLETENREENQDQLLHMLKEVVEKVQIEVENERKEREESQETLLNLIEDTCDKMGNHAAII